MEHPEAARNIKALKEKVIIPDFRHPNIIRLAPVALYNNFEEVCEVVQSLKEITDNREYQKYDLIQDDVT
ncbi:MAG: hypothetical protein PHI72_08880 [Atribacterota bacterium]|nr:hypothetical protein [Atribacterota bacterium]MDD4895479.1 hypothetical protein [Atribacterota bacterium]MDD5637886.1 hypothetical protein [Atribacterota bacterium]